MAEKTVKKPTAQKGQTDEAQQEEVKAEELVLAQAWAQAYQPNELYEQFVKEILSRVRLGPTGYSVIDAFTSKDVKAEKIGEFLRANPYYESQFLKVIASLSKRDTLPSVEAAVVLLGMQKSRDLVVAFQIIRHVLQAQPEWTPEGKLQNNPQDFVKYALATEEELSKDKGSIFTETAYAAGLVYDLLNQIGNAMGADPKKFSPYIDQVYKHGVRAGRVAMELSTAYSDFHYKKFAFALALLHDVGKIAMVFLDQSYLNFIEEARKKELPRQVLLYTEQKKYGINHAFLGFMILQTFNLFKSVAPAVLYHHDPYIVKKKNKNLFQLAAVTCLSTNVASFFRKPDKPEDPVVQLWKGIELKDLPMSVPDLIGRVAKVIAKSG